MKTTYVIMTGLVLVGLAPAARAHAAAKEPAEKKLQQADVPKAVLDAVTKKYPTAKLHSFEQETADDGKLVYEIGIDAGRGKTDVELSPEGKIVAEESVIPPAALPAPVKAGVAASKYKGWKLEGAEQVIKNEKTDEPLYELVFTLKKQKFEVVFDKAGKITEEEAKDPRDRD
jgi:hypothetical protein